MGAFRGTGGLLNDPLTREHADTLHRFLAEPTEETFAAVFVPLYVKVRRFFSVRGCEPEADELAQDVLLAVYRHVNDLREHALFYGWLFRIARNRLLQHLRENNDAHGPEFELLKEDTAASDGHDPLRDYSFRRLLSHVDPQARQILAMRFVEELEYDEIAYALGIPSGTVKWKVFHAKSQLRELIKKGRR
jgi:RNA polymerase sigma-70 factor (ECF subfamily)